MDAIFRDLRYGVRMLVKSPGFTAIAVLTLALGIGANTAIFSVVNAVLVEPLPYSAPDRLVQFWETNPMKRWTEATVAPANLFDWQDRNRSFEDIAAYSGSETRGPGISGLQLTGGIEPERIQALFVTGNLFSVLGVNALLGRTLTEEETWSGKNHVLVLSYATWQRRFGGDPGIVGKKIPLNGIDREVVGVMSPDFFFPSKDVEMWLPMGWDRKQIGQLRRPHFLRAVGRLKSGVTLEQARADVTGIAARLEQEYPTTNTQMGVGIGPLKEWIVSDTRLALVVFLVAVAFVLFIACANVANLLLARAAARAREVALRSGLGAPRRRIVRQLLTESLVLAAVGGALGLVLSLWCKDLLVGLSPGDIPRLDEARLDTRVLAFSVAVTLLTTLMFGLVPALHGSKPDLVATLKEGGQRGSSTTNRLRGALVVAEVALALVLLMGAGLMVRSFEQLQRVDPGFNPDSLLMVSIDLPGARYPQPSQATEFFTQAEERVKALPGVVAVGTTNVPALKGYSYTNDMTIPGRPPEDYIREVRHKAITPDYFQTMGIPLVSGRFFNSSDSANGQQTIIVNEAFALRCFPGEETVGKQVKFARPSEQGTWETIVGVVRNEKQDSLSDDAKPEAYKSYLQEPQSRMTLVIRTKGDPEALAGPVREEIRTLDKDLPPYNIKSMRDLLYESLARQRFTTMLLIVFAGLAVVLASVGIYGVMSYAVAQRTHEIGIRMALGAQTSDVSRMVIAQGMRVTTIGVGIGLGAAFLLTRLLESLLFKISTTDPATFILIPVLLAAVSLFACYLPARRAMRVDPLVALRYE
jgi:predicted permease